jgi:acyl carrier protein
MLKDEILNTLLSIARTVLDDDDITFDSTTEIREIPEWDSLNNMHIVVRVEKKLGLDFQQSDFETVVSIGDLIELIEKRQAEKSK